MKAMSLAEPLEQVDRVFVRYRGRKLIYFGGCDYYRLATHPQVRQAAARAMKAGVLNVAASRITTGNHPKYEQLEAALRAFFQVDEVLLTSTGYTADLVIAQAFAGRFSHAVIDERAHASLRDATRFLDCPVFEYRHRDAPHAAQTIARCGPMARVIVLTEGVFAHDGSLAPLPELLKALPNDGRLLLDEAHSAGVLGKSGRGTLEHFGLRDGRVVRAITLSKAFGTYGGAVLGKEVRTEIISRSVLFAGSTPPPIPLAAAALVALRVVRDGKAMRDRLRRNMDLVGKESPIMFVIPESPADAARLKRSLLKAGIFPSLIRYPNAATGGSFRFAISSEHTRAQIERLRSVIGA